MPALPLLKDSALTLDERVAILTFKRNDVRNALSSTELTSDIVGTLAWANASPDVSVLILTGEGSAFSAGGKLPGGRCSWSSSCSMNPSGVGCTPRSQSLNVVSGMPSFSASWR